MDIIVRSYRKIYSTSFQVRRTSLLYRRQSKLSSDGNLQFHGRIDDQVKIRGFRIELGEIEAVLQAHSSVKEAVVLVREDNQGDKRLVAYVVGEGSVHEWREHLQTHLPNYMVPTNFIEMEVLPLTPNGKLDLKALPILSEQSAENTVYPTNREELIASVWRQVLGIKRNWCSGFFLLSLVVYLLHKWSHVYRKSFKSNCQYVNCSNIQRSRHYQNE